MLSGMRAITTKLHSNVKSVEARGGSSVVEVGDKVIIFGGANSGSIDTEPVHFNDVFGYTETKTNDKKLSRFELYTTTGDIPMPRSGHTVAAYGKYMFLFGGAVYSHKPEDSGAFGELYIFCTETFKWNYVGEKGVEIRPRGSHSMGIVYDDNISTEDRKHYLVIYGGSSPDGVMNDTIYAELPRVEDIDMETIFADFKVLPSSPTSPDRPNLQSYTHYEHGREMAGTCCSDGVMYVSGGSHGNDEEMRIFNDVWTLSVRHETAAAADKANDSGLTDLVVGVEDLSIAADGSTAPEPMVEAVPTVVSIFDTALSEANTVQVLQSAVTGDAAKTGDETNTTAAATATVHVVNTETAQSQSERPQPQVESQEPLPPLIWTRRWDLDLPTPRCGHGACVVKKLAVGTQKAISKPACLEEGTQISTAAAQSVLVSAAVPRIHTSFNVYGGFNMQGIKTDLMSVELHTAGEGPTTAAVATTTTNHTWKVLSTTTTIEPRIGISMCGISDTMLQNLLNNTLYKPVLSKVLAAQTASAASAAALSEAAAAYTAQLSTIDGDVPVATVSLKDEDKVAMLLYGGAFPGNDFGDVWLFTF